jgi:glutamate-1-semialdehyde aminotransferase
MSWSVQAYGHARAVDESIAEQFATGGKCSEPEETVRQAAAAILKTVIRANGSMQVLRVTASGSQSTAVNQLNISVEPQYGFLNKPASGVE